MAKKNSIFVKGAREHNLKNVDVEIPREKFESMKKDLIQ